MRYSVALTTRILIFGGIGAILMLFGAIVGAQGDPHDPEGGRVSPVEPADDGGQMEMPAEPGPNAPVVVSQDPENNTAPAAGLSPDSPAEIELNPDPEAPSEEVTLFKFIAGLNFYPRESSTTHQYGGAGCSYRTSTSGFLISDLQLPEGAEIDFMRLYFYDANTDHDVDLYLYSYDAEGSFEQIATVSSSGAPGRSSADSGSFSHVVSNSTEALSLVVGMDGANNNTAQLCGVRLRYKLDVPSWAMLPAVLKQHTAE